jgi:hypothetical protein
MKEPQKASEWGKLIKGKEEVDNTLTLPFVAAYVTLGLIESGCALLNIF